jgi:hypothetical protein
VLDGEGTGGGVRFKGKSDDGLQNGREHEGPRPSAVGYVHPGCATDCGWQRGGEALAVVVSSRLRAVGDVRRRALRLVGRVCVGSVVPVEGLSSQEGCARLVVRNFGRMAAAMGGWQEWI